MRLHAMLGKQKYKSEVYKEQLKEQRRRNKELEDRLAETSKQLLRVQGRDDETVQLHTETKIISLSKELEQKEQRIKDLTAQNTYLQSQTTALQSQMHDAQTESRTHLTHLTHLQNTHTALSKNLQESHAQVTHLRHVVMTGDTEKKALEDKLRVSEQNLCASEDKLCVSEENLRVSEETLHVSEQNLHASEENLRVSEQNLHVSKDKLRTSEQNLHTSECARKHISNELLMQVNANMHLVGEIKGMEERVRFLERERDGFRVELDRRMVVVSNVEEVEEVGVGVLESTAVEAPGEEEEQVVGEEDESLFGI
ncbi:uncharacterized protein C8R40DRAFT_1137679 [Lentinula edodes]|uniref:uncharacterized protein n=1 Tax=Lentinula edodes TaxID=5353 RepID=UPI001E8DF495|nr:uncharacterized protein C8R40DRAFT_1137679 [Lentinula edodes]KAH7867675.1 hypothetical protein C8R40DRAFT_1137679 [Lentinula edodes]